MTKIYNYCLNEVRKLEEERGLKNQKAKQIYAALIEAVQHVQMNLGVAKMGLAQFRTELSRHSQAVEKAITALTNSSDIEIKIKAKGKKSVTLKSQVKKSSGTFILFTPAELIPYLLSIKNDVNQPSPRQQSKQTEAIKCFVPVARHLTSSGMSETKAAKFIDTVLVEMGLDKISLQQISKNLFS